MNDSARPPLRFFWRGNMVQLKPAGNPTKTTPGANVLDNRVENPVLLGIGLAIFTIPIRQRTAARLAGLPRFTASSSLKLLANLRLVPLGQRAKNLPNKSARRVPRCIDQLLPAIGSINRDPLLLALAEKKFCNDHVARNSVHPLNDDSIKLTVAIA